MITKFQQGGQAANQKALMQFVQGIAQVLKVDPKQIVQIAQQKPESLNAAVQVFQQTQDIQQAAQAFAQAVQKAKQGAKLQYISSLKNKCKEDEELVYMKAGGRVCPVCQKKKVQAEKCGGAVKEFKAKYSKCGGKMKKKAKGGQIDKDKVTPNDTIHINGKPRALVNVDGPTTKKYPALTNKEYQTLRQQSKKGDKEATRKLNKQNAIQH